jgi:hypothetical protein
MTDPADRQPRTAFGQSTRAAVPGETPESEPATLIFLVA